jgi:hypothetical protein
MNAQAPDPLDLPLPPECAAAIEFLHRWLDRETIAAPPEVATHASICPDCGGRFAASGQFATALIGSEPQPPSFLSERIVGEVLADGRRRRRVRRWSLATAGLAAGVIAALWFTWPRPAPIAPPSPAVREIVKYDGPPPPDLRQEFTQATVAVASLTQRAAVDAVGAGRQLVPDVPSSPWPPTLEPVRPIEGASAALADGFEPVTTSARRAARLFWRDLSMEDEKK